MTKKAVCLFLMVLALSGFAFHVVAAQGTSCTLDLTSVASALSNAQTAAQGGDSQTALSALGQVRADIDKIQQGCVTGQGASSMSDCQYLFDATVRDGADKGLNLHGTLALVQDSDTTASGIVVPSSGATDQASLVPVTAKLDGLNITLTFNLPASKTITGMGTMEAPLSDCKGTMQGNLTGPAQGDTGDWLSGADLSGCISRGIHNCVASGGANGSAVCGISVVQTCQSS